MTMQRKDPFHWRWRTYDFLGAKDIYSLFDPEAFGLHPESCSSDCWKGFVISFRVKRKRLYIIELEVYCEDGIYPEINGVKPRRTRFEEYHVYRQLNMPVSYTGTITIGTGLNPFMEGNAFLCSRDYRTTYELDFTDGLLSAYRKISNAHRKLGKSMSKFGGR